MLIVRKRDEGSSAHRTHKGGIMHTFWIHLVGICIFNLIKDGNASTCSFVKCGEDFEGNTRDLGELGKNDYFPYCSHLNEYMRCVEHQANNCRGNLYFHGVKISLETLFQNNDCQNVLKNPPKEQPEKETSYMHRKSETNPCAFRGKSAVQTLSHCGLFGDPHLKTFNNTFQTCRVRGAWAMLSSSHLSIQVTNEAVGEDLKATATTKVTVLVKGEDSCGLAKTYEASREELPKAFVDGTTYSGADSSTPYAQVLEALPGQHIVIKVNKINSTVNLRKVGKYLSVSVTAPQEVVNSMNGDMQLCDQGCPPSEVLEASESKKLKSPKITQAKASSMCSEYNVTDFYLDSCVFDLMTTGDVTFRDSAYLALRDMWHNDPKASFLVLKNCTSWPCLWHSTSSSGGSIWHSLSFISCTLGLMTSAYILNAI